MISCPFLPCTLTLHSLHLSPCNLTQNQHHSLHGPRPRSTGLQSCNRGDRSRMIRLQQRQIPAQDPRFTHIHFAYSLSGLRAGEMLNWSGAGGFIWTCMGQGLRGVAHTPDRERERPPPPPVPHVCPVSPSAHPPPDLHLSAPSSVFTHEPIRADHHHQPPPQLTRLSERSHVSLHSVSHARLG